VGAAAANLTFCVTILEGNATAISVHHQDAPTFSKDVFVKAREYPQRNCKHCDQDRHPRAQAQLVYPAPHFNLANL
jgi:hypothetical protein